MIEPALTPDGWRGQTPADANEIDEWWGTPHQIAAGCLYGQPFGFTRYDVTLLRHAADFAQPRHPELHGLADRIEALLPPEA